MHLRSTSLVSNLQRISLGLTISAAVIAGQAQAQTPTLSSLPNHSLIDAQDSDIQPSTNRNRIRDEHRYSIDIDGNLVGQVTTNNGLIDNMSVFLMQNQQIVNRVTTNKSGQFSFANTTPGRYSVIVAGQNQMAAEGIMVEPNENIEANKFVELTTIETKFSGIQELAIKTLPAEVTAKIPGSIAQQVSAVEIDINREVRIINGQLNGYVTSLIKDSNAVGVQVHLLHNSQPIAQVETNSLGGFSIPDIQPGVYDLVAAGPAGFAAMRIEAVGNFNPIQVVSYRKTAPIALPVQLAEDCPCNQSPASQPIAVEPAAQAPIEYASESLGCGCACGGCGAAAGNFSNLGQPLLAGRGGFGGGLLRGGSLGRGGLLGGQSGGLARLLTLGGIAGGIVAIADDEAEPSSPNGE